MGEVIWNRAKKNIPVCLFFNKTFFHCLFSGLCLCLGTAYFQELNQNYFVFPQNLVKAANSLMHISALLNEFTGE
jgi:hypothetical protein